MSIALLCNVATNPTTLARQVVEPVRWEDTMRGMLASGVDGFVELGPGAVLTGLLKRTEKKAARRNVTA